ncbi:hypothetical protein FUAX_26200 [Fulvitalea axinellae]|uniref:DAGKc domain-containing protein n=1 Tax=Fulvitalea axinellae TaxID=1182444 RepID=A0AAU9CQ45_9BACT|nr:hypothetical protein FUAX_26200 [Fulvitalea axinellae]
MPTKEKILFVVNPVAGTKNKDDFSSWVETHLGSKGLVYEIRYTERRGHAVELVNEALEQKIRYIVAVGGDGTVNEVARGMVNADAAMGVIPMGSGNGLARSLGIPLKISDAIARVSELNERTIDAGYINGEMFLCTAGVGFDAHIGKCFEFAEGRGLSTYVREGLKEFAKYKPLSYRIESDGKSVEREAFALTFANAPQYGNNAYISPNADMSDGLLDMCLVEPFTMVEALVLVTELFTKNIHRNERVRITRVKEVKVLSPESDCFHVDGEYRPLEGGEINVRVSEGALKVLV